MAEHDCSTGYHAEPTRSCYATHRCRCDGCRQAQSAYQNGWKEAVTPEDVPEHGIASSYRNYGCRCEPCTAAHSRANREYDLRAELRETVDA